MLLSFITRDKFEIFKGTVEYHFGNCNVRYKAIIDENLTIDRVTYYMYRRYNNVLKWKIGNVDSDVESKKTPQVFNQSLQDISMGCNPTIKLKITFDYSSTIDDNNHQYGKDTKCFLNVENQCPFEQFSFIPVNGEKLINFLKHEGIIQQTSDKSLKRISVLLYAGDYYRNRVSAASIAGKLSNVNGNNNQTLYNEIEQLQQLGFEFGMDNVDLSVIFDKIRLAGINTVCHCLKRALAMKQYDLNDFKSWLKRRDSPSRRRWSLTQIQWEKLYQTQLVDLIEYVLSCKQQPASGNLEVERWIINDTQNWNILHYGAYLNDCKLIEIGQKYIFAAGKTFDSRTISKDRRIRQQFLVKTNNFCKSQYIGGNTPLHIASRYGNVKSLNKLINFKYGSNCFKEVIKHKLVIKNYNGETPLELALRYDNIECVKVLFKTFKFKSDTNKLLLTDFGFCVFTLLAAS